MKAIRDILLRVFATRAAWPILIAIALLCVASLHALQLAAPDSAARQQTWLLAGCGLILIALIPHYNLLGRVAYVLYAITIVMLIGAYFTRDVQNTHRWFVLPGSVQLQPSEFAKISFVLALAWHLRFRKELESPAGFLIPCALAFVPFVLILREPDLGTALLFPFVLYAMLLAAGAPLRYMLMIALVALVALPGSFPFLKPYQQERVLSAYRVMMGIDDPDKAASSDYHQRQSIAFIGSGGTSGAGDENVKALQQGYLPEAHTDFIFAVIGTGWGFAGSLLILAFNLAFFAAGMEIASTTRDHFGRLLVVGLSCMILCQAAINMWMTVGPMPVVGIALPFVSYGGSSLMASMLAAGLLLNVSVRRKPKRL